MVEIIFNLKLKYAILCAIIQLVAYRARRRTDVQKNKYV
jgi:hypothetical protein